MPININGDTGVTFSDGSVQDKAAQASGTAPVFAVRAWVTYDAISTPVVKAAGNVSSITDVAVGRHNPAFTSAMPDAFYAVVGGYTNNSTSTQALVTRPAALVDKTTSSVAMNSTLTTAAGSSLRDGDEVYVTVFR